MTVKHLFVSLLVFVSFSLPVHPVDNETCLECHSDKELTAERGKRVVSMYVNAMTLAGSIHKDQACTDCHVDADVEDFPHAENLEAVNCGNCHDEVQEKFNTGIHGTALKRKMIFAPTCTECHGKHFILSTSDPRSPSYKMKVPFLCGKCHKEGAPVARTYNITEHNIIENYSQSIHGEGLFRKGLIVTAACVDCHTSHMILPHTDRRSSTSPRNVAETCMVCHSRIEDVHTQVIEGEKWEMAPGAIPSCTDCHLPHKARKGSVVLNVSDNACLECHNKDDVHKTVEGKQQPLKKVSRDHIDTSVHKELTCVKCHADVDPRLKRPCEPVQKVDCSACHLKIAEEYAISGHGQRMKQKDQETPGCVYCHGNHTIKSNTDETSGTFRTAIPQLCGKCHSKDSGLKSTQELSEPNAYFDYSQTIHGTNLTEKGLLVSATCTDCHSTHMPLGHQDNRAKIFRKNIPATCGQCHRGIYKEFTESIHFAPSGKEAEKLPTCTDCHSSHKIAETGRSKFLHQVTDQCGVCHKELSETFRETMHGKAHTLGYDKAATCTDCHTAHSIHITSDPKSSVNFRNIVKTCQQCHEDANERFTGYLTHATHHDRTKYPILFYVYWAMTLLLVGVFTFFGLHTLLWFPRSIRHMKEKKLHLKEWPEGPYFERFSITERVTHLFVILSFISLALTGMILKFSHMAWAGFLSRLIGGVEIAGAIHRLAAVITFGYFITHVYSLIKKKKKSGKTFFQFVFGPDSMMFNKKDLLDFWATLKWFIGKGPRPDYGRWTYWEKFDYFAVFWGVNIIGLSGLMLWFPEFFTKIFPGWLINVATIIHSDEALLAVGFIFTIHFFNTHLRPDAFPIDKVIFTGLAHAEEYKKERPQEYRELVESGEWEEKLVKENVPKKYRRFIKVMGFTFLGIGVIMIILIIYSMLFGYK